MTGTARRTSLLWAALGLMATVVATVLASAAPGRAAFTVCPAQTVTAGDPDGTAFTISLNTPEASFVQILNPNGTGGTRLQFLDSGTHESPGPWSISAKVFAIDSATSGTHTLQEKARDDLAVLDSCTINVTVVTTTTVPPTTEPPTTTTTTQPPTTTTTQPPTTTTTTQPPTTTTTTSTTTTTTTTVAPTTTSTIAPTTSTTVAPTTSTTSAPTTTSTTSSTTTTVQAIPGNTAPPGSLAALPPETGGTGTPLWIVVVLVSVIVLGVATIAVTIVPGAAAVVDARLRPNGETGVRPTLRQRLAGSWLGALVWNRSRRVKGPTLTSRLKDTEFARAWRTRRDVKRARNQIEDRRRP